MVRLAPGCLLGYLLWLPLAHCGHTLLSTHIPRQHHSTNFTDLINQRPSSDEFVPAHVVELLKTLRNKPECHQVAAHLLITSCQSIREDTSNPRPSLEALETTKSIFAARLAICELREANANAPPQCKTLLTVSLDAFDGSLRDPSKLSGKAGDQVSTADLRACLQALEARPQSWTSYSNSRHHAALICHVARDEIKKDEALNFFHFLTALGSEISQVFVDALQRAHSQRETEMKHAKALKDLHAAQVREIAEAHQVNKAAMKESNSQLTERANTILSMGVNLTNLQQMMKTIFISAATGGAELASVRRRDAQESHDMVVSLKQQIQNVTSNEVLILREGLVGGIGMASSATEIMKAVREDSSGLQEVVHRTGTIANQTAEKMLLAGNSAVQKVQLLNERVDGMIHKVTEFEEHFGPLDGLLELLLKISVTVQTIFSKDTATLLAVAAFIVASVVSVSCCFGLRYGYYLTVGYFQAVAAALVVRFVPFDSWSALALSNPRVTLSSLGAMAIIGLMTHLRLGHRLLCAARLRKRSQPASSAMVKLPRTMRWEPITADEASFLTQHDRHRDLHRSRRAQTTPPRL